MAGGGEGRGLAVVFVVVFVLVGGGASRGGGLEGGTPKPVKRGREGAGRGSLGLRSSSVSGRVGWGEGGWRGSEALLASSLTY